MDATDRSIVGGTSARDLPESVKNCQDLSSRPDGMPVASVEIKDTPAQDPAYRPARPLLRL
jgi:hypothetical protein